MKFESANAENITAELKFKTRLELDIQHFKQYIGLTAHKRRLVYLRK